MMEPDENFHDAKFNVIFDYVRRHIQLEEEQIHLKLKEIPLVQADALIFITCREKLGNEFGMPDEYEMLSNGRDTV